MAEPNQIPSSSYINASILSIEKLMNIFKANSPHCICLFGENMITPDGVFLSSMPYIMGTGVTLEEMIKRAMITDKDTFEVFARGSFQAFIEYFDANHKNPLVRRMRECCKAFITNDNDASTVDNDESLRVVFEQIAKEHHDTNDRIAILSALSKRYRKDGKADLCRLIDEEIETIKARRASMEEASRVKRLRNKERLEEAQMQHDIEHMNRRLKAVNEMRAKLDAIEAEIKAENRNNAPQFQPASAAKAYLKKQKQKERDKRERRAGASSTNNTSV